MSPEERVIAYIDGFNLYYGLKERGWKQYYWLNLEALVTNLLTPPQRLVKTKYFTSHIRGADAAKIKRQRTYLDAIATLGGVEMFYGHYLLKNITCWKCNHSWPCAEEKMTDVNIAVELLTDAHRQAFDTALIISGDSDLGAAVLKIREPSLLKTVIVAFPPERTSKQLQSVASSFIQIRRRHLANSLFPDPVMTASGHPLARPSTWV